MLRLIFVIFFLVALTGCVVTPTGFGANYQGRHTSVAVSGVVGVPQQGVVQQRCLPAVVINPNHHQYRQTVCALPGDPNVRYLVPGQQVGTTDLDPNRCPGGYRLVQGVGWVPNGPCRW
jgi:hypothetical protein